MFFLGLLSTPLPYLLLAAFYFFGFAMGMFNNNTGDEVAETAVSHTISAEIKQKPAEHSAYYFQIRPSSQHNQYRATTIMADEPKTAFIPDTGPIVFHTRNVKVYEIQLTGCLFSRPPPSGC